MTKQFFKDALGWGFSLWLIGYALGMLFFPIIPVSMIGWAIMPLGSMTTLWVLTFLLPLVVAFRKKIYQQTITRTN